MTEREKFLALHEREYQITHRLLEAFPAGELSYRPHERSRSARELAFILAHQERMFVQATKGTFDPKILADPAPSTLAEILRNLDSNHRQVQQAVSAASETELNQVMQLEGRDMRRMDVIWANLFDLIHHRGQFSVYVRIAGGKVPSIYGPSADDPGVPATAAAGRV